VHKLLAEQQETASELRALNATLEQRVNERTVQLESARDTLEFAGIRARIGRHGILGSRSKFRYYQALGEA
jgi:hypothetical protein